MDRISRSSRLQSPDIRASCCGATCQADALERSRQTSRYFTTVMSGRSTSIYARLILEAAGVTMSFVFLVCFFSFIGWLELPEDVLQIAGGWFMLAWFGSSLALFLGALSETSETVEKLWHPAAYILFPLSGAAFLVSALPDAAQKIVLASSDGSRRRIPARGLFSGPRSTAHYDMAYMALWNVILTLLGLAQTRKSVDPWFRNDLDWRTSIRSIRRERGPVQVLRRRQS